LSLDAGSSLPDTPVRAARRVRQASTSPQDQIADTVKAAIVAGRTARKHREARQTVATALRVSPQPERNQA
jgi:hypothetical protein